MASPDMPAVPEQSRVGDRRMRVDPRAAAMLAFLDTIGWPSFSERTPAQARSDYQVLVATTCRWGIVRARRDAIADRRGHPSVPVRVYWPLRQDKSCPVVVWFHGGGFVVGDLFTADSTCRKLATASRSIVVSVDYRRAPEHPVPAPQHDAVTAAHWVFAQAHRLGGDPRRVVLAGDSAGGALVAHTAQFLRDHTGHRAALQVLVYPATDFTLAHADRSDALAQLLTWDTLEWFAAHSLSGADRTDPAVSPYFVPSCADLPPAHLVTAEVDPFRSDAIAYAERLTAAGVPVTHRDYRGQIHGFIDMDLLFPAGVRAIRSVGLAIRAVEAVPGAAATAQSEPIRWRTSSATMRRLVHETMVRNPGVNTARLMSALADQQWRNIICALELPPINAHPSGR
jgi:acetyl esterase